MKTTQNVAKVSAQLIRAAVTDVRDNSLPINVKAINGLDSLEAIATELDQYAGAFEAQAEPSPKSESPALCREGPSGAGSTVQQAGDAYSEGSKSSAPSMPSEDDCTAATATQAERSVSV